MASKTLLPPVEVNDIPTTTDGSTAPTAYTLADGSETYYDVGDSSVVTLFCEVHQAPTGTTKTLDIKIQHAPDTSGPWDDVPSGSLTQFTTAAGIESVTITNFARYIRIMEIFGSADCVYSYSLRLSKIE